MRFEKTWRNKWLTSEAKSIGEMADALQEAADELRAMEAKGVVLAEGSGVDDDYATLVTEDQEVARELEFESEDSSAEETDDSDDAEDSDSVQILGEDGEESSYVSQAKFLDDFEYYLEIVGRTVSIPEPKCDCGCCPDDAGEPGPVGQLVKLVPEIIEGFQSRIAKRGWDTTADHDETVHSTGLFETFGHPEVVASSWYKTRPVEDMVKLIDRIGESVKAGKKYDPGVVYDDLLPGAKCVFIPVDEWAYPISLGAACKYYGGIEFPALQCVWSDATGRFPWDDDWDDDCQMQLILGEVPDGCVDSTPDGQAVQP